MRARRQTLSANRLNGFQSRLHSLYNLWYHAVIGSTMVGTWLAIALLPGPLLAHMKNMQEGIHAYYNYSLLCLLQTHPYENYYRYCACVVSFT